MSRHPAKAETVPKSELKHQDRSLLFTCDFCETELLEDMEIVSDIQGVEFCSEECNELFREQNTIPASKDLKEPEPWRCDLESALSELQGRAENVDWERAKPDDLLVALGALKASITKIEAFVAEHVRRKVVKRKRSPGDKSLGKAKQVKTVQNS